MKGNCKHILIIVSWLQALTISWTSKIPESQQNTTQSINNGLIPSNPTTIKQTGNQSASPNIFKTDNLSRSLSSINPLRVFLNPGILSSNPSTDSQIFSDFVLRQNSKFRSKRALKDDGNEKKFFQAAFKAIYAHQGQGAKYLKTFNELSKNGNERIDFKQINGLGASGYNSAIRNTIIQLNTAYSQGDPDTKRKAYTAMKLIPGVVGDRDKAIRTFSEKAMADGGHVSARNAFRKGWEDLSTKANLDKAPPALKLDTQTGRVNLDALTDRQPNPSIGSETNAKYPENAAGSGRPNRFIGNPSLTEKLKTTGAAKATKNGVATSGQQFARRKNTQTSGSIKTNNAGWSTSGRLGTQPSRAINKPPKNSKTRESDLQTKTLPNAGKGANTPGQRFLGQQNTKTGGPAKTDNIGGPISGGNKGVQSNLNTKVTNIRNNGIISSGKNSAGAITNIRQRVTGHSNRGKG